MTAIAGFVDNGAVWMGGDSAGVDSNYSLTLRKDEKVFRNGEFIFGFTTSFRMGQLLRYSFKPPVPEEDEDTLHFMVTRFVNAIRDCLKAGGYAKKSDEVESAGTLLVGFRGRLFLVDSDYQVGEALDGYDACGCGHALVKAALFATRGMTDAEARLRLALTAAEHHSAGVRGPFNVIRLEATT